MTEINEINQIDQKDQTNSPRRAFPASSARLALLLTNQIDQTDQKDQSNRPQGSSIYHSSCTIQHFAPPPSNASISGFFTFLHCRPVG